MKKLLFAIILFMLFVVAKAFGQDTKPRVIVTTDGEVDDRSSFTRFLLYTPDMDFQ